MRGLSASTLGRGVTLLALLVLAASLGAALWPRSAREQLDPAVAALAPPGARFAVVRLADGRTLAGERAEAGADGVLLVTGGAAREIPRAELPAGDPGRAIERVRFALGSDKFGRDVGARLLTGGRISLAVALAAAGLALGIGLVVGAAAALGGPLLDSVLMRLVDGVRAFPRLFLLIALAAIAAPALGAIVLLLGLTAWPSVARLVRAELAALGSRDFVLAARASGAGPWRILVHHLLPNALAPALVETALVAANAVLAEATLSFLGLGVQPPAPSWGNMIAEGREVLPSAWWLSLFPGLALAVTAIAFSLVGEGLRDRLDPRRRPARA